MTHDSRVPWDLAPQEYTPVTFHDQKCIALIVRTHYRNRVTDAEAAFLQRVERRETISPKQRARLVDICQRVLV